MPTYEFRCAEGDCGLGYETFYPLAEFRRIEPCPYCNGRAELVISTAHIQKSSLRHESYFDHSLGSVVSGQQDREEKAKALGDKEGRNIVFVDPQDTKALGVNDDGLDATRRRKQDTGQSVSTTKHL